MPIIRLNSPKLLNEQLQLKARTSLRFAGQIMGVEGYVESAAMGLITGLMAANERLGKETETPPATTAFGALIEHITGGADAKTFQPMNCNFGLFPPIEGKMKKKERKPAKSKRALEDLALWMETI
ncbi:MAG: FAD-dependent oxidoreductase [Kordiimonadaceae bacterium]|nr:FAD-dependent oxidoreductase [Kordiimonadaceae bacterium]